MEQQTIMARRPSLERALRATAKVGLCCTLLALGCAEKGSSAGEQMGAVFESGALRAAIGPEGGELVGPSGSDFEGVRLAIPKGALEDKTQIEIVKADASKPLPKTAVRCGQLYRIE